MDQTPRVMWNNHNYEADRQARLAKRNQLASKVQEAELEEMVCLASEEELSILFDLAEEFGLGKFLKKVVQKVTGNEDKKKPAPPAAPSESPHYSQQRGGDAPSKKFDEKQHPRGEDGKFAKNPNKKSGVSGFLDKAKDVLPIVEGEKDKAKKAANKIEQDKKNAAKKEQQAKEKLGAAPGEFPYQITETKPKKECDKIDGQKTCGSKYEITLKNGTKLAMYDQDKNSWSADSRKKALGALAEIHEAYPGKIPTTKIVLQSAASLRARKPPMDPNEIGGWVEVGKKGSSNTSVFNMNADHPLAGKNLGNREFSVMPSVNQAGFERYITMHEIGHQFDFATHKNSSGDWNPKATKALYDNPKVRNALSIYGRTGYSPGGDPNTAYKEAYGEAFAEWHASRGTTKNVAAIAYAKHEGWVGANTNVPKKSSVTKLSGENMAEFAETPVKDSEGSIIFIDGFTEDGKPASQIIGAPEGTEPDQEDRDYADAIVAETLKELEN